MKKFISRKLPLSFFWVGETGEGEGVSKVDLLKPINSIKAQSETMLEQTNLQYMEIFESINSSGDEVNI